MNYRLTPLFPLFLLVICMITGCQETVDTDNKYVFKDYTILDYLKKHPETYSQYVELLYQGSRYLGKEVTEYYLREGQKKLKAQGLMIPYELTWLEGELMDDYLHDVSIVQEFAACNREVMLQELCRGMKWKVIDCFSSIHNYIDRLEDGTRLIRKGAISARTGEKVIIPINMRDGAIIGKGMGNPEWNFSAPHGSGRLMKREDVKKNHTVSEFKAEMKGIYSSCVGKDTLDEAPFAYRGIEEIKSAIGDTIELTEIIRPVYNYKAGGKE